MSRLFKLILGIFTLLAPVSLVTAVPLGYWYLSGLIKAGMYPHPLFRVPTAFCLLLWFGLLILYRIHASRTNALPAEQKHCWLTLLHIFNIFAIPFYWYKVIWQPDR